MKKSTKLRSLMLAGLVLSALLTSCDSTTSVITGTDATPQQEMIIKPPSPLATTLPPTTTPPLTTTAPISPLPPEVTDPWDVLKPGHEWHSMTFLCPYEGMADGEFVADQDEMADWLAQKGDQWYIDCIEEMETWPTCKAPLGDRYDALADVPPKNDWTGDRNGLICYTTFTLTDEQMNAIVNASPETTSMKLFYDNAIHIYINGIEVYTHDNNGKVGDWNDNYIAVPFNEGIDIRSILCSGENTVVVSLKNTFGGREFIMGIQSSAG